MQLHESLHAYIEQLRNEVTYQELETVSMKLTQYNCYSASKESKRNRVTQFDEFGEPESKKSIASSYRFCNYTFFIINGRLEAELMKNKDAFEH